VTTKCRRCAECQAYSHHWLFAGIAGFFDSQPGKSDHACKHCDAVGVTCSKCAGFGTGYGNVSADCPPGNCPACNGEGVLVLGEGE